MNMNKKKSLILTVVGIIGIVLITVGVTYAFFNYAKEGTTDNSITTGTITFLYTEVDRIGAGISIEDALPITDETGKALTGEGNVFNFKVTANTKGKAAIPYEITARKKSSSTLDEDAVRVYLTEVDGTEKELLLDNYSNLTQTTKIDSEVAVEKTIYTDKVYANTENYEKNFRLRMWVPENIDYSEGEYNAKSFTLTVNVYANATVVTGTEEVDESKAEITNIKVGDIELVQVENENYHYEAQLPEGTTSTVIEVETNSPNATVDIEKVSSLENINNTKTYSIKKLAATKALNLDSGFNFFRVTVTSVNKKVEKQYGIKITVGDVIYREAILNGADPILGTGLIPVTIANDGTVTYADINSEWYNYTSKKWANAVKLVSGTYTVGQVIPESAIQSYFVWIPRYKYKIFNEGNYTNVISGTPTSSNKQTIDIIFESKDTAVSTGLTVGTYLTHPAFTTLDTNGIWVGKYETGYNGATSTATAQVTSTDSTKIIVKPNVYSWRNNTVYNVFVSSYNYDRTNDSHMMKNTEWGAVAYLSHSNYGINKEININNNSSFKTGYSALTTTNQTTYPGTYGDGATYNDTYNTTTGYLATTTGNISGIYDMSGGTWEYMAAYMSGQLGSSGFNTTNIAAYNSKYFDVYSFSSTITSYNNRILGDATGEIGPFYNYLDGDNKGRYHNSWYADYSSFVDSSSPWFNRGGVYHNGVLAGQFSFNRYTGAVYTDIGSRLVLALR